MCAHIIIETAAVVMFDIACNSNEFSKQNLTQCNNRRFNQSVPERQLKTKFWTELSIIIKYC